MNFKIISYTPKTMNQENHKTNPLDTPQDHDKLVLELKTEIQQWKDKAEEWKNAKVKTETDLFNEERKNARLNEENEELKQENMRQRRIDLDKKVTKNKNEFLEKFQELQANK